MTKPNETMVILAIGSIPLMMTLGNSMLIPILPDIQSALDLTQFQVSLIITVFSFAAAVFIPIFGYLSDRYTRKVIILPSLLLFATGGLISGLSGMFFQQKYLWIIIGRTLQGIGAAGAAPIAMALTGDLFKGADQSRVLGIFEASNGIGKILSPIFGSLVGLIVWYFAFFTFPILCIISFILVLFFVKEQQKIESPPSFRKYYNKIKHIFKVEDRWLIIAYLAGGAALFTLFGILFYLSNILEENYQIDGIKKGFILAIPLLIMVTTSYLTGHQIEKDFKKMKWITIIGFFIKTMAYISLIFFENLFIFLGILSLSSLGTGFILPCVNSFITGAVEKEERGFVSSLYGSIRFVGVALGPPIFSRLMEWSKMEMFLSIATFTLIVGVLFIFFIRIDDQKSGKRKYIYHYI